MLTHEIRRLERKGKYAPLLDDARIKWLWNLFDGIGEGWCDAGRNHPRHGNTVKALLQLACALSCPTEAEQRSSLETAIAYAQDALAGKPPTHHLQDAARAVEAETARIIACNQQRI